MSEVRWVEVPFAVQKPHAGLRVDAYLAARLERFSRAEVQRLIDAGRVSFRSARPLKAATRVGDGDTLVVRYPKKEEPPSPHDRLPVLFEDEHVLAVNKPGDVLSHPSGRHTLNTATEILKAQFPGARLHLAHRLDRETSGVLLLAKTSDAARSFFAQFKGRTVRKRYLAVTSGAVSWREKTVDAPIGREGGEIRVRQAVGVGQSATTDFARVAVSGAFSLVSAEPRTGRLHQIRVHLAHLGHPVLGDRLYNGSGEVYMKTVERTVTPEDMKALGAERHMLHAERLSVRHPADGQLLELHAPPPPDFADCLKRCALERTP